MRQGHDIDSAYDEGRWNGANAMKMMIVDKIRKDAATLEKAAELPKRPVDHSMKTMAAILSGLAKDIEAME